MSEEVKKTIALEDRFVRSTELHSVAQRNLTECNSVPMVWTFQINNRQKNSNDILMLVQVRELQPAWSLLRADGAFHKSPRQRLG